ncbi:hypothetical protein [Niabella ginsengisoli]|uniref:Uncharacterized protein n=1 Tax=Niabella ginsengisoli TaxID=522298 RepID=A0ABS9SNP3_9BACT|nr:hypothetical protein [Niabella ginsengisoli]MCH5599958.1 hypothetical protein [Niabella ginsengisoli]
MRPSAVVASSALNPRNGQLQLPVRQPLGGGEYDSAGSEMYKSLTLMDMKKKNRNRVYLRDRRTPQKRHNRNDGEIVFS